MTNNPGHLTRSQIVRQRPSRRRFWVRRVMVLGVAIVVLGLVLVVADYIYLGSLIKRTNVGHLQTSNSTENILLVGSTSRCALKVQNNVYGNCYNGVNAVNSDIVMVLHLNLTTRQVSLLSIPRDTFIPNARTYGANKIDAALYQGPTQLAAAIEEDFGIAINHFVELNFDTFASVVDALGGIKMYFPTPIYDAYSELNIRHAGCHYLNGFHALQVVRARHLQYQTVPGNLNHASWPQEGLSDLARIRRTHEFLRVLAKTVAARGLGNPLTDQSIATAVLPDLTVDQGWAESDMVSLASKFASTNISNVPQYTYPIVNVETGSYVYKGYYYGDVVFPIQPSGYTSVDSLFGIGVNQNLFNQARLPKAGSFAMSVVNGSGVNHQAATITAQLVARGFHATDAGGRTPTGTVTETVVWYGGPPPPLNGDWHSAQLADAQRVLRQIQGPAIMGYNPSRVTPGAAVTVQTGNDLSLVPLTPPVKRHKHHGTSTTTIPVTPTTVIDPPGVITDNKFGKPTPLAQGLASYDPRACNAAGNGPGPN